jgi:hypothetical protein
MKPLSVLVGIGGSPLGRHSTQSVPSDDPISAFPFLSRTVRD